MGRRLYYRDSYGYVRRDRRAGRASSGGGSSIPGRAALMVLLALAVLVVLASIH